MLGMRDADDAHVDACSRHQPRTTAAIAAASTDRYDDSSPTTHRRRWRRRRRHSARLRPFVAATAVETEEASDATADGAAARCSCQCQQRLRLNQLRPHPARNTINVESCLPLVGDRETPLHRPQHHPPLLPRSSAPIRSTGVAWRVLALCALALVAVLLDGGGPGTPAGVWTTARMPLVALAMAAHTSSSYR